MGVLEPRYQLGLSLEAADEIGVVGELWQDDLDGDFALDQRLDAEEALGNGGGDDGSPT